MDTITITEATMLQPLALSRLLQLASPMLPVGAYAYSQGLETAIETGLAGNAEAVERWVADCLHLSFARFELPVLARLHRAWRGAGDPASWNEFFLAGRDTAEGRAETLQMGYSLLKLLGALDVSGVLKDSSPATRFTPSPLEGEGRGGGCASVLSLSSDVRQQHPPPGPAGRPPPQGGRLSEIRELNSVTAGALIGSVTPTLSHLHSIPDPTFPLVYAHAAVAWGIPEGPSLQAYAWSWLENQVAVAMKAVPIGQAAGQSMLFRLGAALPKLVATVLDMPDEDISNFAPGLSLAGCWHETQYSRLFRS